MTALLPAAFVSGLAAGILLADLAPSPMATAVPSAAIAAALSAAAGLALLAPARPLGASLLLVAALAGGGSAGAWRGAEATLQTGSGSVVSLADGLEHRIGGVAVDDPRQRGARQQLVLDDLAVLGPDGAARPIAGRLLVWLPRGFAVSTGDRVAISARLEEPEDFDGFAYREYLARQGIGAIARAYQAEVVPGRGPPAMLGGLRGLLQRGLNAVVPEPHAALGSGLLLGARHRIAPELDDDFATAGLSHIVAISGWHLAIVTALVAALTGPLDRRPGGRWARVAVTVGSVTGYVLLTGAGPSVIRAALMAGATLLARLGGSRAHAGSALLAAGGVMLLVAPPVLWDVGFQLSLLATAGIVAFSAPIEARLSRLPPWVRGPVSLTLAAQLTTLPVILFNFERLSLVAPLANIVVVPLVPLAMLAAALAALGGVLESALAVPLAGDALAFVSGGLAWLTLGAMIAAVTGLAALPGAALDVAVPAPLAVAWYPILLAGWRIGARRSPPSSDGHEPAAGGLADVALEAARQPGAWTGARQLGLGALRLARPRWMAIALAGALALTAAVQGPDGHLHLLALDVGQGDAILARMPSGATLLVDGGPDPDLTLRRLGEALPFFERRIDVMILSHPHQDHVAGLVDVLERFEVGLILHAGFPYENQTYDRFLADAAAEPGGRLELARAGQTVALDATTTLEIIYPTDADAAAPLPDGDINNGSVVALLRHGQFAALLTGDAEAPVEAALIARGAIGDVDVLKVGHHGSSSSTTASLVEVARPEVALISSGADNEYGHPAPETLATLGAWPGIAVLRTDLHGTIEVTSDGIAILVRTERPGQ